MKTILVAVLCSIGVDTIAIKFSLVLQAYLWNLHTKLTYPAVIFIEIFKLACIIHAVRLLIDLPLNSVAIPLICIADLIRGINGYLNFRAGEEASYEGGEAVQMLWFCTLIGQGIMVFTTSALFTFLSYR